MQEPYSILNFKYLFNRPMVFEENSTLAQEKLEWVTPKISLMRSAETESKTAIGKEGTKSFISFGPS